MVHERYIIIQQYDERYTCRYVGTVQHSEDVEGCVNGQRIASTSYSTWRHRCSVELC